MDDKTIMGIVKGYHHHSNRDHSESIISKNEYDMNDVDVTLERRQLWNIFNLPNEMIVTKAGRRMFPVIEISISGLDPAAIYHIGVEFVRVDNNRWKYVHGWTVGGKADSPLNNPKYAMYLHPESPNYGRHWMKGFVKFVKVKITNRTDPPEGQVLLSSLHKYMPRIHVIRADESTKHTYLRSFDFPEAEFIAVTAYNNDQVTKLKITHNPFARAFNTDAQNQREPKQTSRSSLKSYTPTTPSNSSNSTIKSESQYEQQLSADELSLYHHHHQHNHHHHLHHHSQAFNYQQVSQLGGNDITSTATIYSPPIHVAPPSLLPVSTSPSSSPFTNQPTYAYQTASYGGGAVSPNLPPMNNWTVGDYSAPSPLSNGYGSGATSGSIRSSTFTHRSNGPYGAAY